MAEMTVEWTNTKETLYLSGPMTNKPDWNVAEFNKYAEHYRTLGYNVLSPAELDLREVMDSGDWKDFVWKDLKMFFETKIDAVYVLPGWKDSRGARLEVAIAKALDIPIHSAETGTSISLPHESVTQEAYRIVHGDRGDVYSHPLDDFGRIAKLVSVILGVPVTEEQVALIQICVKLSRLCHTPTHRDSIVDVCGYGEAFWMVHEERERRRAAQSTAEGA